MTERPVPTTGEGGAGAPEPAPADAPLAPEDDAVIGRAFRWSVVVLVVIAVAVAGVAWLLNRAPDAPPPIESHVTGPQPIDSPAAPPPPVIFTDVTAEAGIDFVHTNGATGDKLLPETMGAGAAFLDYDGDGDQDLLLVNSTHWPGNGTGEPPPTMALYRNDGRGRFENVTAGSGLAVSFYGTGIAVGDYDNDGDVDVFITAVGVNHLFLNDGGTFREVTDRAGVAGDRAEWSTSAGFFDYDNDGRLDLIVCNYVRWSPEIDLAVDYRLTGIGRAYGPPTNFGGTHLYLYRNNGDGTFTDVSEPAGIRITNPDTGVPVAKALGVAIVDLDDDGYLDLFVANDTVRNFLFRNNGNPSAPGFDEVGAPAGVAYDGSGNATGAMGVDVAHFRNEDGLGFGVGNFANEMTSLYLVQGSSWQFADVSIVEGIGGPSRQALSFGLFFFDYDLDGRLDLLQTNGHLEEEINTVQRSQHYRQPAQLFWNSGRSRSCFAVVPPETLGDLGRPIVGRGAAYADIDADGDLDVLLTQTGEPPLLLRNDQALGHHWLRCRLIGRTVNRDAIGAWVGLTLPGEDGGVSWTQRRQVMPTRSYLCQVELPVTFGLGRADRVEALWVTWPDGSTQMVTDVPIDTTIVIEQRK